MVVHNIASKQQQQQQQVVVLDTCVLISNVLRFLSLGLAYQGYFQPAWSPIIRDEWLRNASRLWQVEREQLATDWARWEADFPCANQGNITAYKDGLIYSDPKDWHVIAAARAAQVQYPQCRVGILTKNLKDFNRSELKRLGIERLQPDAFFCDVWAQTAHRSGLQQLLHQLPTHVAAPEQPPLPCSELLKREQLFNLNAALYNILQRQRQRQS